MPPKPSLRLTIFKLSLIPASIIALNDNLFTLHFVTGASMAPALSPAHHATGARDLLLVRKPLPYKDLQRGAVVVLWQPHNPERVSVKRIVALDGDTVYPGSAGGAAGEEEVRRAGRRAREARARYPRRVEKVPYGHVWVEGDNWRESRDSNDFGPVSKNLVAGKVEAVVWPPSRWGAVRANQGNVRTVVEEGVAEVPWVD